MSDPRRQYSGDDNAVAEYKEVLRGVLDRRPSGMRQKLAHAIGKNRSFISQISNPAYPVPVPVQHLDRIFEICHFSEVERRRFLDAYGRAHPRRFAVYEEAQGDRNLTVVLPDLGSEYKNRQLDALVRDMVQRLTSIIRGEG